MLNTCTTISRVHTILSLDVARAAKSADRINFNGDIAVAKGQMFIQRKNI